MKPFFAPISKLCLATTLALTITTAPQMARAQPDPNNVPKAQNPDNRPVRPTPQQREAQRMTRQIERLGLSDQTQQKAVLEYIEGQMQSSDELQASARALNTAMRTEAVTDQQVATLLNNYNVAVEDQRAHRKAAQLKLNETVNLLQLPRIEAFLTLAGLYGDAPAQNANAARAR